MRMLRSSDPTFRKTKQAANSTLMRVLGKKEFLTVSHGWVAWGPLKGRLGPCVAFFLRRGGVRMLWSKILQNSTVSVSLGRTQDSSGLFCWTPKSVGCFVAFVFLSSFWSWSFRKSALHKAQGTSFFSVSCTGFCV